MAGFNNIKRLVIQAYNEDHSVADDDKLLIARIWEQCGWNHSKSLYDNLCDMPSAESIRRTRQKLVADGTLKASEKATSKRYEAYKNYRKEFAREQWECL